MAYDQFGRTPEQAEADRRRDRLGCAAFAALIVLILSLGACTRAEKPMQPVSDSLSHAYTADGEVIKIYVVVDADTGIQYVVSDHGGITPRLGMD